MQKPMKRLNKIQKWTVVALSSLVVIGLVANAAFIWITDRHLESQLAEIRAAGDPVTLADLARPSIPPEKNAATYLRQAEADATAIEEQIEEADTWKYLYPGELPLPPQVQKTLKSVLDAHPNVIPLLERAAACQDYDAQLDYTVPADEFGEKQLMPALMNLRTFARVLGYRALLQAAEGDRDGAVRTALVLFRLGSHFDRNPGVVSYLIALIFRSMGVNAANLAMQTGPVSKEVRDALDTELARQEPLNGYSWLIKSERAYAMDYSGTFYFETFPYHDWVIGRGVLNRYKSNYLDGTQAFLALVRDAPSCRQAETIILNIDAMTPTIASYTSGSFKLVARTRAVIRALRVLNALQSHMSAGSNEVPKLHELGLPAETTTDPFTGEPLHVKKTPRGWLVYSVGSNFKDDGGKLDNDSDVGVGPQPLSAQSTEK